MNFSPDAVETSYAFCRRMGRRAGSSFYAGFLLLPAEKRFTRTNIRKLTKDTPLMDSGLLGPVRLLVEQH